MQTRNGLSFNNEKVSIQYLYLLEFDDIYFI